MRFRLLIGDHFLKKRGKEDPLCMGGEGGVWRGTRSTEARGHHHFSPPFHHHHHHHLFWLLLRRRKGVERLLSSLSTTATYMINRCSDWNVSLSLSLRLQRRSDTLYRVGRWRRDRRRKKTIKIHLGWENLPPRREFHPSSSSFWIHLS